MTENQYQFMLRTGKYLPEEDIKSHISNYYFEHFDSTGKCIYYEDSNGEWEKREFKNNSINWTYYENSDNFWEKREYNNNNLVHQEDSSGFWRKREYNNTNICINVTTSND